MRQHNKFVLSVLTLCISQYLYAQDESNSVAPISSSVTASATSSTMPNTPSVTLDAINVVASAKTGTALAQKISEMPAVTQVIYEDEIQTQVTGNRTTSDILAQLVPSLGTGSGSTSNYATTMRGRPVQYLLNGVPLTGSRNISRELNSIDPAQLERVEVLSGATSIYGAGAAGGLINLVTKSTAGYGFEGQSRIGMNSSRDFESESFGYHVGQSLGYGGERVYGSLDVDYESEGGKFNSKGNRISPDVLQTDQQDTDSISVNANLGIDMTDTQTLSLAATYYEDEQDTDYGFDYGEGLAALVVRGYQPSLKAIEGAQIANQPRTEKTTVNLNYNNKDVMGSNLSITGYYRDEEGRFYPSGRSIAGMAAIELEKAGVLAGNENKLRAAVAIAQSEANIEVAGLRAALQTDTTLGGRDALFSYGVDFEREESEQTYYGQDFNTFYASQGLIAKPNGVEYNAGPETTIDKLGAFINADVDLTNKWSASAGIRYQNIEAKTDAFIPMSEQMLEDFFVNYINNATYEAGEVKAGEAEHDKILFNLGTSYQLTPTDLVFANFSQGFTTADVQRALRDVRGGFIVNEDNVQPISINNYELGWQGHYNDTSAKLTAFYNDSDKTVRFTPAYLVEVLDTDERIYGAEAAISHNLNDHWQVGGTAAYTRGQYDYNGDWIELDATRLTPLKGTAFVQYNFDEGSNIRLQALAIDGTDKAFKEQQADPSLNAQPITGYATLDLTGQVNVGQGRVNYGIYNLLNKDYKTVYHQSTYGAANRMPAAGTNYGISYTIDY